MTAETIHTCSYECERPGCIRAQRDELAARLTAETSNAREWVLVPRNPTEAMIDAWRDSPDIWEDAYAAMLAAAPQPAATAAKDAEIEALRAEVELLKKGIVPRDDDLIVPVKLLDEINASGAEWKDRAEQLAEALSHQRWCRTCAEDGWESCEDGRKADALLRPTAAQENGDA